MGKKIVLTGNKLTDTSAPILSDIDAIMPTAGALLLLDPVHPAGSWASGVPAANARVPNLAFTQAKALIPAGTTDTLAPQIILGTSWATDVAANNARAERTAKGGLSISSSRANIGNANRSFQIQYQGGLVRDYLYTNRAHSFFFAYWGRVVRPMIAFDTGGDLAASSDGSNRIWGAYFRPAAGSGMMYPTTNGGFSVEGHGPGVADTPFYGDVGGGDGSAYAATAVASPFQRANGAGGANNWGKMADLIFYGAYLEDLTVSGRSYATVSALVKAKYTRDVKTSGGKYFGDTYSSALA